MTQAQGTTGRLLAGRYRLGEVLGRGGMGTVWRARDETLGRTVAVKELRLPGDVDDDEKHRLITRTLREAKATARIRSTGAVTVFDVVEEDDRPWIVMELVESRSLSDVIRDDGPLPPRRAAEVGLAVLDVLRAAHREGILHRDVKPSNVLIADDGRVVLTDFGIAQVEGDPSVTSTGMLVGAPSYISPERARGSKPGPASDLWSLGALLYAAVEGHPPYDKSSAIATLTAVMTEPVERPVHAGPLAPTIYGLLRKDPEQRLAEPEVRRQLTGVIDAPEDAPTVPDATGTVALPTPRPPQDEGGPAQDGVDRERQRLGKALRAVRNERDRPPAAAPPGRPPQDSPPRGRQTAHPAGAPPPAVRRPLLETMGRKRLIAIAVAVLVAVVVLVIVVVLVDSGGGSQGSHSTGGKKTPAPSGASGRKQAGTDTGKQQGTEPSASASASTSASHSSGTSDGGLPKGYHTYTSKRFHFSMAVPDGWKETGIAGQGSGVQLGSGDSPASVQVDYTGTPGADAAKAWYDEEDSVRGGSSDYHRLSIKRTHYRGYPTVADWQFTRRAHDGTLDRVLNRGFRVDPHHGYAILITAPADQWGSAKNTQARTIFFKTFKPVG